MIKNERQPAEFLGQADSVIKAGRLLEVVTPRRKPLEQFRLWHGDGE